LLLNLNLHLLKFFTHFHYVGAAPVSLK